MRWDVAPGAADAGAPPYSVNELSFRPCGRASGLSAAGQQRFQPRLLSVGQVRAPGHRYCGHEVSGLVPVVLGRSTHLPETSPICQRGQCLSENPVSYFDTRPRSLCCFGRTLSLRRVQRKTYAGGRRSSRPRSRAPGCRRGGSHDIENNRLDSRHAANLPGLLCGLAAACRPEKLCTPYLGQLYTWAEQLRVRFVLRNATDVALVGWAKGDTRGV